MENSKFKSRDIQLIFVILGLVILFLAYKFGYKNISKSTESVNKEVETLEARNNDLKDKKDHQLEYEAQITEYSKEVDEIFNKFPQGFKLESCIEYIAKILKDNLIDISSISYTPSGVFYNFVDKDHQATEGLDTISSTKISLNYSCSYTVLKNVMDILNFGDTRIKVEDITTNYSSESGGVSGTVTLSVYYSDSADTGRKYVEPDFDIDLGKEDVFETFGSGTDNKKK